MAIRYLDKNFKENKYQYIIQSLLAGFAVAAAMVFFDVVRQPMIIASFGASGFVAFTMPHRKISAPRCLIGGYIIGVIVGCLIHLAATLPVGHYLTQKVLIVITGGAAVGVAMFLMTVTNTEHAPAAGIALGFVINDWTFQTVVLVLVGIVVISTIQRILRPLMIDLL